MSKEIETVKPEPKTIKVWTLVKAIVIIAVIVGAYFAGVYNQSRYQATHQAEINKEAAKLIKSLK